MSLIPQNHTRFCNGAYDISGNLIAKVACPVPGCKLGSFSPVPFKCHFYTPMNNQPKSDNNNRISLGFTLEDSGNGCYTIDLTKVSQALVSAFCNNPTLTANQSVPVTLKGCTCPNPPEATQRPVASLSFLNFDGSAPPPPPMFLPTRSLVGSVASKSYGPVSTGGATPREL